MTEHRSSGFLAKLRRRNVIRMAGLYLVGACDRLHAGELGNTMDWGVMLSGLDSIRCEPRFQAVVAKFGATDLHAAIVCVEE